MARHHTGKDRHCSGLHPIWRTRIASEQSRMNTTQFRKCLHIGIECSSPGQYFDGSFLVEDIMFRSVLWTHNVQCVDQHARQISLTYTSYLPVNGGDHCGDHCASIQRPRQHLSHHGNGSAFTLPSLRDLLCHCNSFGRSRKAQGSCCSSYTETELSGFRRPLSVLTIFMVAQRWHEGRSPV